EPEAGVVRGRAAPWTEASVLPAGVERIAAEAEREHLERQLGLEIAPVFLPSFLHQVEDLRGRPSDRRPGLLEVRLLGRVGRGVRREERGPEPKRKRAGTSLERVHRGGTEAKPARPERDPARIPERRGERAGEARRAGIRFLVVVLRGDPHQVLESELEV